ncbi:cystathionine beta-lyase/cystathionine gamma-synthase [Rhizobium leguminosarum bv. trifolii WSM597]|uniref:Cystathionine beta-lyase/cystathionine gamma-synthase n=1 Tax=Rhizobium leguminosarum bv. trifolii WSM597 TaxID=754764 RepID=J0H9M2_RHILT|nr:aminotransferase class I/II-fold pyridoxal phosphate-dependent enzyme [Rhizobium leguminosarum]EJB07105.1 cystathionine beta-lyase/cystathionine gamma-synthase [Rhizobium leguminosarum bv. trifolii WSM597]
MTDNKTSILDGGHHGDGLGFDSRAIHYGFNPVDFGRAVQPPVFLTSTYGFESVEANEAAAALGGRLYAREYNPTTEILEKRLAHLEGAEAGLVVSTGMAAFGTLVLSLLSQGDELVVHKTLYSNTISMIEQGLPRFGIKVVPVDLSQPSNLDEAITDKTRLVYFETPVNPLSAILDIEAIAQRAHARGVKVAVDSTFASPALQRPIEHGADIVLHSLTKYINGHGDALGGALLGDAETLHKLHETGLRYITGATLSPHSAFLILRGLKTLSLRMDRHSSSALTIAQMLEAHPAVGWVSYPFLDSHSGKAVAQKQMSQGSGMLAFGLKSGFDGARKIFDRFQLLTRAVSLGDTDSLIYHPASIMRARQAIRADAHLVDGVGDDLIRLSVGLENVEDLVADLRGAMQVL